MLGHRGEGHVERLDQLADGPLAADDGWNAAHVDEDWNAELWGMDEEAAVRRAFRRSDYDAALVALAD